MVDAGDLDPGERHGGLLCEPHYARSGDAANTWHFSPALPDVQVGKATCRRGIDAARQVDASRSIVLSRAANTRVRDQYVRDI